MVWMFFLMQQIVDGGAVAADGRLKVGQRILEVLSIGFKIIIYISTVMH